MNDPIDDHQVSKCSHRRSKASIIKTPLGQPTPSTGMSKQHASLTCVTVVSFDSARLVASGAHFCPQAKKKGFSLVKINWLPFAFVGRQRSFGPTQKQKRRRIVRFRSEPILFALIGCGLFLKKKKYKNGGKKLKKEVALPRHFLFAGHWFLFSPSYGLQV